MNIAILIFSITTMGNIPDSALAVCDTFGVTSAVGQDSHKSQAQKQADHPTNGSASEVDSAASQELTREEEAFLKDILETINKKDIEALSSATRAKANSLCKENCQVCWDGTSCDWDCFEDVCMD